ISAMSSGFKLDAVMAHDYDGPVLISSSEEKNLLSKAANTFHTQGIRFSRLIRSINHIIRGPVKEEDRSRRLSRPLLSGAAYCISSCSMMLLNKVVLSSYNFNAGISPMFYQNLICTIVVLILGFAGAVSLEKLNWKLKRVWVPVNLIFVGMLATGMFSLKYVNIAMVTILKNMTNILSAIGEVYIFQKHQNHKVWIAVFLLISALSGVRQQLTLRQVMDKAKNYTSSGSLNEVSMVLLNNILSLPFAIILILLSDEWNYEVIRLPMFWVVSTASGLLGLAISFTSMWFLHQTGPTTYSLVGSLNKIPISIAGIVLFKVPLSLPNLFSILFGLFAGVLFALAKMS
ncbi:hypothetical protein RJ641_008789, partial [Dillenia turbinata]